MWVRIDVVWLKNEMNRGGYWILKIFELLDLSGNVYFCLFDRVV